MLTVFQGSIFSAVAGFLRLAPAALARVLLKVGLVWLLACYAAPRSTPG